jgi:hypothetical protein
MQPDLFLGQGYGTSINQTPQYSFEYPAEWEEDEITKTEKSTMVGTSTQSVRSRESTAAAHVSIIVAYLCVYCHRLCR